MIEVEKDKKKKKIFPIDLKGALKDGWKCVDEKVNAKKIVAEIDENLKKYQPKK
jgi:hypothetical protein